MHDRKAEIAAEVEGIWAEVDAEGRSATAAERRKVEGLLSDLKRVESDELFKFLNAGGAPTATSATGPGDVFIASGGYKQIKDASSRPQQWSSGLVQVSDQPLSMKGTLLQSGAGGPGGGAIPPYYEPGIVSKLFEPLGVAQLFGSSQTTGSQVRYVNEGTALSGAAGVAEAGVKPESTIAMSELVEPIRKIATVLPISDEMLEDAPSIQAYLNSRLSLFVSMEEERQLLRGSGTNELVGVMNAARGINTTTGIGADNLEKLARAVATTAGSANVQPDAIVMHPTNWLTTRLLRAGTAGDFLVGGGPSSSAGAGLFGQSVWGLPVVLSSTVGAGTALVGSFGQAAHIWRRGGLSLEATNSHSDYYVRNLTMLRAESRAGLGVYRASAFTEVRGLT